MLGCLVISQLPSVAVVGYVNATIRSGYNFVANPLDAPPNNNLTNLMPNPPNGTRVWVWNVTNQVFDPRARFLISSGWDLNFSLPPGRGFVVHTLANFTNTFVGNVLEGSLTNFVAGTNRLSLLGHKIPVGGPLATALLFPGGEGDVVSTYPSLSQQFQEGHTYLTGHGWFDPQGSANTNGPVIDIATSFFVRHRGPDANWVRSFTVALTSGLSSLTSLTTGGGLPPPTITRMTLQNGDVTLYMSTSDRAYNVQFSTDRVVWNTIATNQIGVTWTDVCPATTAGYFQLTTP